MNHTDAQLVNDVVARVLKRLGANGTGASSTLKTTGKNGTAAGTRPSESGAAPSASVTFDDAVITEAILADRIGTVRTIEIGSKSLLTPSAKEFVSRNKITVERATAKSASTVAAATWLAIVSTSSPALDRALDETNASGWQRELSGTTDEAVIRAGSALSRGEAHGAVVFSAQPMAACCLANRQSCVRAAVITDAADVAAAKDQLGANLLCLNPAKKTAFELRNIFQAIIRAGTPKQPTKWKH